MGRKLVKILGATALLSVPTSAMADDDEGRFGFRPNVSTSDVQAFDDPGVRTGISRLFRDKHSVRVEMTTADLTPDAMYTVWWIIFNNPRACANGSGLKYDAAQRCDDTDLFNQATKAGIIWGDGFQASSAGTASFTTTLLENDASGDQPFADGVVVGPDLILRADDSLKNSKKAEVHVVLRYHGAPEANGASVAAQLTSYDFPCTLAGICADTHLAVHAAKRRIWIDD